MFGHLSGTKLFVAATLLLAMIDTPLAAFAASVNSSAALAHSITETQRAQQVLSRLTFGARPGDLERVRKVGVDAFIARQLDPYSLDDSAVEKRLAKLRTLSLPTPTLAQQYNPPKPTPTPMRPTVAPSGNVAAEVPSVEIPKSSPSPATKPTPVPKNANMVIGELRQAKLLRAVYSERQLFEVTVDFWENHFSIFGNKDADRWMLTSFDRDAVRPNAFGRFRDLLGATAHSPAMLYFLDNWQSSVVRQYPATKDKPARSSGGINENYARELMELHTLGVDGGYTQKDVQEVARCFTGWTIRKPNEEGLFVYDPALHDNGEKTVLGVRIPAGGGPADGERVLDILAKSPATAKFITTKLARRFLGDDPAAGTVERASKVFLASDGSIAETLKSIIMSKDFFASNTFQSKVKTPFEFVASALRSTDAETTGDRPVLDWISRMGQPVLGRLTPDGYPDVASEWLSSNDLLARLNFASALAMNRIKGTTVKILDLVGTDDARKMPDNIATGLLLGGASAATQAALDKLLTEMPDTVPSTPPTLPVSSAATAWAPNAAMPFDRNKALAEQMVALALGSPEFQHR